MPRPQVRAPAACSAAAKHGCAVAGFRARTAPLLRRVVPLTNRLKYGGDRKTRTACCPGYDEYDMSGIVLFYVYKRNGPRGTVCFQGPGHTGQPSGQRQPCRSAEGNPRDHVYASRRPTIRSPLARPGPHCPRAGSPGLVRPRQSSAIPASQWRIHGHILSLDSVFAQLTSRRISAEIGRRCLETKGSPFTETRRHIPKTFV